MLVHGVCINVPCGVGPAFIFASAEMFHISADSKPQTTIWLYPSWFKWARWRTYSTRWWATLPKRWLKTPRTRSGLCAHVLHISDLVPVGDLNFVWHHSNVDITESERRIPVRNVKGSLASPLRRWGPIWEGRRHLWVLRDHQDVASP